MRGRGEPGWAARPRCRLTPPPARTEPAPPAPGAGGAAGTPVRRRHLAAEGAPAEPAAARGAGGVRAERGECPGRRRGERGLPQRFSGPPSPLRGSPAAPSRVGRCCRSPRLSGPLRPPPPAGGSGSHRQRLPGSRPRALRAAGYARGLASEAFRVGPGRKGCVLASFLPVLWQRFLLGLQGDLAHL